MLELLKAAIFSARPNSKYAEKFGAILFSGLEMVIHLRDIFIPTGASEGFSRELTATHTRSFCKDLTIIGVCPSKVGHTTKPASTAWSYGSNTRVNTLRGLLIDIERKPPDASRYEELQNGIIQAAALTQNSCPSINVSLDYIHFTDFEDQQPNFPEYDFFILSPQGCPWSSYRRGDIHSLNFIAGIIREFVFHKQLPVLGICGGHQFLTMAFGGEVGLIDNNYGGIVNSRYPKDCVAERGPTVIITLKEDPIFEGITVHPGKFCVIQNHVEEVKIVPPAFINLASSELSALQLIRLPGKIVYGTAFHPERGWSHDKSFQDATAPKGKIILANFLKMAYAAGNSTDLD